MINQVSFYGGARFFASTPTTQSINGLIGLPKGHPRVLTVACNILNLPDARSCRLGGPQLYIISDNVSLEVKDNTGTILVTLADMEVAVFSLVTNSTAAGVWAWQEFGVYLGTG